MSKTRKFKLEIVLDNVAMQTGLDVSTVLKTVVRKVETYDLKADKTLIFDENGNSVGFYQVHTTR